MIVHNRKWTLCQPFDRLFLYIVINITIIMYSITSVLLLEYNPVVLWDNGIFARGGMIKKICEKAILTFLHIP